MNITGTHINYYFVCKRKLWLFANDIQMEHTSEIVEEGKLIHESTYQKRAEKYKEIEIDGIKIDYYDTKNHIVHEVKKTSKIEEAHIWQLKYYIFVLQKHGIPCEKGLLEYPKLKNRKEIVFTAMDKEKLIYIEKQIIAITDQKEMPPKENLSICKACAYYDFCRV
jgi:CRISPR-associated exonuclease Cas4